MKKQLQTALAVTFRFALAFGILGFLFSRMDWSALAVVLAEALGCRQCLAAAAALFLVCLSLGIARWKLLLGAQGIALSWRRTAAIYFIGHFFNSFMFGATGGDLVRAYYAIRQNKHLKTETVATVVLDRVIGLAALLTLATAMLALRADFFIAHAETRWPAAAMLILAAAAAVGMALLPMLKRLRRFNIVRRIEQRPRLGPILARLYKAFALYRGKPGVLAAAFTLSLMVHLTVVLECYCLGWSLAIKLPLLDYLTVVPVIMCLAAIPITPSGLGLREGLSVTILRVFDVPQTRALSLSLLVYFIGLLWSLVGGMVFLAYSAGSGRTIRQEVLEIEQESAGEDRHLDVPSTH